jgi:hypothetical protein
MNIETAPMIDEDWSGADAALDRAFQRACEIGRQTGTPVWVIGDGPMVDYLAQERRISNGDVRSD